jgi:hypothetical protein
MIASKNQSAPSDQITTILTLIIKVFLMRMLIKLNHQNSTKLDIMLDGSRQEFH